MASALSCHEFSLKERTLHKYNAAMTGCQKQKLVMDFKIPARPSETILLPRVLFYCQTWKKSAQTEKNEFKISNFIYTEKQSLSRTSMINKTVFAEHRGKFGKYNYDVHAFYVFNANKCYNVIIIFSP